MRIRTALIAVILLTPLLLTACEKERVWVPVPTPTPTSTPIPAVQPIPWEFPLWSEVLGGIEECIPGEDIFIQRVHQKGSKLWLEGCEVTKTEYGMTVIYEITYDFLTCLQANSGFSDVKLSRLLGSEAFFNMLIRVGKDYTVYVDGRDIWETVYPANSSKNVTGFVRGVVEDAGVEIVKTVQNTSTMTVDGLLYKVESYEFTALADEGLLQIIEFLGLLEESGQREWPIVGLNTTGNQSIEEMTINQSETSSLWKIDDLRLRYGLSRLEFKLLFLFR